MSASIEDPFVKVWFDEQDPAATKEGSDFYEEWRQLASAKHQEPTHFALHALKKLYPKHSVVMTGDYRLNILSYPGVIKIPVKAAPLISNLVFIPLARSASPRSGLIADFVELGAFHLAWQRYDMTLYLVKCPQGGFGGFVVQSYIIHDGPEEPVRALLTEVGIWAEALHNEVWMFDSGYWQKSASLWNEAQKANWDDVILKDEFKSAFRKDIYGFFKSEQMYKELAIPWKRGIIMYGPPGNGKTISIKAIIKECDAKGLSPLYVKSFRGWQGEEGSMAMVFDKARQLAPCVVILEDLDSLINDENRSFFLNQLDGLEGNDGLLVIGTTNHFERLDPGLSSRPSRFDRKFLFDDPDREERVLYAKYWQEKLRPNKNISFPDELVDEVASKTDRFSFAYLKEAFVSSLVTLAGIEGDRPSFASVLKSQIATLRKQLDKPHYPDLSSSWRQPARDVRPLLDNLNGLSRGDLLRAMSSMSMGSATSNGHNSEDLHNLQRSSGPSETSGMLKGVTANPVDGRYYSMGVSGPSRQGGAVDYRSVLDPMTVPNGRAFF